MANKSLLIKDIKKLTDSMDNRIKYVDIDYDIKRPSDDPWTTRTRSMICYNDYALLNGYRLWLQSRRYDYIRAAEFGGLFDYALNDRVYFSEENEDAVKAIVIEESSAKWPDIVVLDCQVKAIMYNREWQIKIVAQDKNTKLIISDDNILIPTNDDI